MTYLLVLNLKKRDRAATTWATQFSRSRSATYSYNYSATTSHKLQAKKKNFVRNL